MFGISDHANEANEKFSATKKLARFSIVLGGKPRLRLMKEGLPVETGSMRVRCRREVFTLKGPRVVFQL